MNRQCYRLVFNRARGLFMAVAETATSCTCAPGQSDGGGSALHVRVQAVRLATWLALGLVGWTGLGQGAGAQIHADRSAPGNQRPTVLLAPNGVPLVNIQTPSAAGVSRNNYSRFDVDPQGAILNNSRTDVQSRLGGWVQANPWLAKASARVILNEINSNDPSQLRGYVEVAGQRAQVVIANAAGITCDGCGFINAGRATLTTGTPQLVAGDLAGWHVEKGTVRVSGSGLDARDADYTDILARAVQLDANVVARTLDINAAAIDVSALGGMYAGSITLVGHGAGVGVRNAGYIGASAGDLVVTSDGRLENTGTLAASGNTRLDAQSAIANAGRMTAKGGVAVGTRGDIDHSGVLAAGGDLQVSATGPTSAIRATAESVMAAGVQEDGSLGATGRVDARATTTLVAQGSNVAGAGLDLRADGLDLSGSHTQASEISLQARNGDLVLAGAQVAATQTLVMAASQTLRTDQARIQANQLRLEAQAVSNRGGALLAIESLRMEAGSLGGDGQLLSLGDIDVRLVQDYTHTGVMRAARHATLETTGAVTNEGDMTGGGTLRLKAGSLDNRASGSMQGAHVQLTTDGDQPLVNRGLIDGEQVDIDAAKVHNLGTGRLYGDRVAIRTRELVNAAEGGQAPVMAARERIDLGVGSLDNREHALIFSAGDMVIGGSLDDDRRATGQASAVRNTSATIEALGHLHITAQDVVNTDAHFTTEVVTLPEQQITELAGQGSPNRYTPDTPDVYVYNDESDFLHTPEGAYETWYRYEYTRNASETRIASADPARILSGGDMHLNAGNVLNDKGHFVAGGDLIVKGGTLTNTEPTGQRTATDVGVVVTTWREHDKGRDTTGSSSAPYLPPARIDTITLGPSVSRAHAVETGSGASIQPLSIAAVDVNPAQTGVRTGRIDPRIPANSLFRVAPDPASGYLVETDPRFASYRQWLGSDYLLSAMPQDGATLHKRLGDGFHEQRLIREQVTQLTGQRLLAGYVNDEDQFRALMDNGITVAQAFQLRPGVALSAQQVAQLTSDIVWLVEQEVSLPDGRMARALVPQVYLRVREGDLQPSGALIAGRALDVQLTGDLANSGAMLGREAIAAEAQNLRNLGGRIASDRVVLRSLEDLDNIAGQIRAGSRLVLDAGRDLNAVSTTVRTASSQGARTAVDRVASLYVASPQGSLVASAGRDVNLTAASLRSEGSAVVQAGRDLALGTVDVSSSEAIVRDPANYRREARRSEAGTVIESQGDTLLIAGQDLAARAASVTSAQGDVTASAARDVRIEAGESRVQLDERHRETRRGFLSSKTTDTHKSLDETTAQASTFSGQTTVVEAGRDLVVTGSQVVSDEGTRLVAGRDVTVQAATEMRTTVDERKVRRSGLFSSGGLSVTLGTQKQSTEQQEVTTRAAGSTVGSVNGDVRIEAGETYRQVGSEVLAPRGDIGIEARRIEIVEARETQRSDSQTRTSQSGLTVSLSNPVLDAARSVHRVRDAARQANDSRMQTLATLTQALTLYEAGAKVEDDPDRLGGVSLNISLGSSRSSSRTSQSADTAAGSRVVAGGDLHLRATGSDTASDILVQGSRLEAGGVAHLQADHEVRLLAARNESSQHSENHSASASVGVGLGFGEKGGGLSVTASVERGRGRADGEDVTWTNTQVQGGQAVRIDSGGDTTLRGAVVSAPQVTARIGGDLVVESLQDTGTYTSRQRSAGGSVSVNVIGAGASTGQVHASRSDAEKRFASVIEQSGVVAGDGGFDIAVLGRTDLKAGIVASSDEAVAQGRNRLETATLTSSDLENRASAQASSSGFSLSSDMFSRGKYGTVKGVVANTMLNADESMNAQGQTLATVSAGAIVITDEAAQRSLTGEGGAQAVARLHRDAATAHAGVARPDVESMQRRVEAHRVIKEETFRAVTAFTDEAYRSRFEVMPKLIKVVCPPGADCVNHKELLVRTYVTREEFAAAQPGAVLAVNGILNDEKRGAELAYQNLESKRATPQDQAEKPREAYLLHVAPSRTTLSELMGAAYEKIVAEADYGLANFLGYTNGQTLYADLLRSRRQQVTESLGHSRGTQVQEAAFTILANTRDADGQGYINPNLTVRGVGGAANVDRYTDKAAALLGDRDRKDQVTFTYFDNDPVSTSGLAGGNPGAWSLTDLWQVVSTSTSMHSCYGSGAAGCSQVEAPLPGGPQGTAEGNARLVRFVGGRRVLPDAAQPGASK